MDHLSSRRAFTLIELLVVIAIIAVLVSILLPALGSARKEAWATQASAGLAQAGVGVMSYTVDYDLFPPSYVYAQQEENYQWNLNDQRLNGGATNPYVHWSGPLVMADGGRVAEDAFSNAALSNGGAPRTNPGDDSADWEDAQRNGSGQSCCGGLKDMQAARMAFTGNAAIFPRNKFFISASRRNRLVSAAEVENSSYGISRTILATEFYDSGRSWDSLMTGPDGVIKSHRPVTPFIGISAGTNVYGEPIGSGRVPRFAYPARGDILDDDERGANMIEAATTSLNAVGDHHPGGKVNYVFVDGHVERLELIETVRQRMWGDRFYSLTGNNRVALDYNEFGDG